MAGNNPESFAAFRNLVQLLLSQTIMSDHDAVRLVRGPRTDFRLLGGYRGPTEPIELRDGRFLRVTMNLFWVSTEEGNRVKVDTSNFQYQTDKGGDRWICRYDYSREAPGRHPSNHLHLRGTLCENCLEADQTLERVHFPTNRVSLEAVIRMLIEQFNVPANTPPEIWRPLLTESEELFLKIAHQSASGPAS